MIVLPAIDILDGRAVRLRQGDYNQVTVYNEDPIAQALAFREAGAQWLHIVDLDGARDGIQRNLDVIRMIIEQTELLVEVGGGIRSMEAIQAVMDAGATRCVLGTKLVTDPEFIRKAASEFGLFLVAGIDARDGRVAIEGWREGTSTPALELVAELRDLGLKQLVYTDIARDGMQTGIDAETYRTVAAKAGFPVIASGGVSTLEDIAALAKLGTGVVESVIVGRALYEGAFALDEAIAVASGVSVVDFRQMMADLENGMLDQPGFLDVEDE